MEAKQARHDSGAAGRSVSIRVIGVGGAGGNAVKSLAEKKIPGLEHLILHTDARLLGQWEGVAPQFLFGAKLVRGLGAGGDADLGRLAAEEDLIALKDRCGGADLIFVLAGLGGGSGTGAAPVIARLARETGALVLGIVTLPFAFEGPRRARQAEVGLQRMRDAADAVICLANQDLCKVLDETASVLETFQMANERLAEAIQGICQMLINPGLVQIDFAEFCGVLRGRHSESSFASAQASGENRVKGAIENLMSSPFLGGDQTLREAETLLISLVGGPDLTMGDINGVREFFQSHSNADWVLGAAISEAHAGRLGITVVASKTPPRAQTEAVSVVCRTGADLNSPRDVLTSSAPDGGIEVGSQFLVDDSPARPSSRFVPPAPELSPEKTEEMFAGRTVGNGRAKRAAQRLRQGQLALEIISKGRFEKSEPTIHHGEDLDVPTYIRRGVPLN